MTVSELLESCSTDSCCLTTAGSGAVTGLNMITATKPQTLEFTGMNVAAVVSTGCGCGPSADSSVSGNKCECEASIDVEHNIPVQQITAEGIHNKNTFIADNNFGFDENQVTSEREEQSPKSGCCGGFETAGQPSLDGHGARNDSDNCCVGVATSRSEDLLISHKPIMAGDK